MNSSLYLRNHLLYEKKIASSLTKGVNAVIKDLGETTGTIENGIERASWYASCLSSNYQDVCQKLKIEDRRAIKSLEELYKRRDVILDMLTLYIEYVLKDKERTERKARSATRSTSELLAGFTSGRLTKKFIAYSLAKTIAESSSVSFSLRIQMSKKGFYILTAAEFYGKVQKAAMAARRLEIIDPQYYNILHMENLEMLYIYIDPILENVIYNIKSMNQPTGQDIIRVLEGVLK